MHRDRGTEINIFLNRLKKIGIKIELGSNFPWIYIDKINGHKVIETFKAEHGFLLCVIPKNITYDIEFSDISEIFKLIRKYPTLKQKLKKL